MHTLLQQLPSYAAQTTVRRLRTDDLADFHQYRSSAELAKYQGWEPISREQALAFLLQTSNVEKLAPGAWIQLGIALRNNDELIGDLGLFVDEDEKEAELGFTLKQEFHGQGHATRAVLMAVAIIFSTTPVQSVRAVTDARNMPSVGVLTRAGFSQVREQHAMFKGETCLELVYQLSRNVP